MGQEVGRTESGDASAADLARALCATARLTLGAELAGLLTEGAPVLEGGDVDALARLTALLAQLDASEAPLPFTMPIDASGLFVGRALRAEDGTRLGHFFIVRRTAGGLSEAEEAVFNGFAEMAQAHARMRYALDAATRQAALYRLLADTTTDTIVRGTLDGVRTYISPSVRTLLGYEPEEMIGRRAAEIVHPDDAEEFGRLMADMRAARIGVAVSEMRQRHRDGSWVWMEAFVKLTYDATGKADGYVTSVRNISRRKEAELKLLHMASHDSLTGLPNRALLKARLEDCLSRGAAGPGFALLCADLDHFKRVNDASGHAAGDALLCAMADRCRAELGPDDLMARLGGDEFAILHTGARAGEEPGIVASASRLAERLIAAMAMPFELPVGPAQVGLSVGIALPPAGSADDLLRRADHALYCAKRQGRGTLVIAEPEPPATV